MPSNFIIAQIPQGIPNQSTPIDLTSFTEIVLYIILPVLMIGLYIFWRKKRNEKK